MSITKFFSLPLIAIVLVFVAPSSCNPSTKELIDQVCQHTTDIPFCSSTLSSNVKSPNTNMVDLTKLTADIELHFSRDVLGVIIDRRLTIGNNHKELQLNQQCEDVYRQVMRHLTYAKLAADREDFKAMAVQVLQCGIPIGTCEDEYRDPVFLGESRKMRVIISMAMYEISQIWPKRILS